jgi:HEAT repeat protein
MLKGLPIAVLLVIVSAGVAAQSGFQNDPHPVLVADKLREKGVSLDRESLMAALRSTDHEVRSLAASQLAGEHAAEAFPGIVEAYKVEDNPLYRVTLAYAATSLRQEEGSKLLRSLCSEGRLGPAWRLQAASYLIRFGDAGCLGEVLNIIRGSNESGERAAGLFLLPHFATANGVTCEQAEQAILFGLSSHSGYERSAAVTAMAAVCKSAAVPHLERALKMEQEQFLREKIERELKNLQKSKPKPQAQ